MSCRCNGNLKGITCKLSDSLNLDSIHQDIKWEAKLSSGIRTLEDRLGMQFKIDRGYIYQLHNQQRYLSGTPSQEGNQGRILSCSQSIVQLGTQTEWWYLG